MNIKRILLIFCLFLLALTCAAQKVQVKIMSWNILSFQKEDNSGQNAGFPIDDFYNVIKNADPDIVCLNEFETGTSRMAKEKMSELASRLDMFGYFIKSYPKDIGYYGNVILSKYPIISSESKLLTYKHYKGAGNYQFNDGDALQTYGADQRSVGAVEIIVPVSDNESRVLTMICTHLDHMGGPDVRLKQVKEIIEFAKLKEVKGPTLLAGDLNIVASQWGTDLKEMDTLGDRQAFHWVDYIYSFPKGKWTLVSSNVIMAGNLSDHDAITALITFE